jgi:two-component system chemotaxis sensor kinase CheA
VLRPTKDALPTIMEQGEMAIVHDRLLPIVRLHKRFSIEPKHQHPYEAVLIVCETTDRSFCLMVDQLDGKQEVVIKNLGAAMKDTHDVAGGAILGDGRVGLILDIQAIGGAAANA